MEELPKWLLKRHRPRLSRGLVWVRIRSLYRSTSTGRIPATDTPSMEVVRIDKEDAEMNEEMNSENAGTLLGRSLGRKKVLVARVSSILSSPTVDRATLSDAVFGTYGDTLNLQSQYRACSYGQLDMQPSTDYGPLDVALEMVESLEDFGLDMSDDEAPGVIDLKVWLPMAVIPLEQAQYAVGVALRAKLGGPLWPRYDHVLVCMPPAVRDWTNPGWIAHAYLFGRVSLYADPWCAFPSAQMHEVGHNLGLGHSGRDANHYGDETGLMGYSYQSRDYPAKCFNAAKSWDLGWYRDRHVTVGILHMPWAGTLVGPASYGLLSDNLSENLSENNNNLSDTAHVLVRLRPYPWSILTNGDYYLMFNERRGINFHTTTYANRLTIVTQSSLTLGLSKVTAGLAEGQTVRLPFTCIRITLCRIHWRDPYDETSVTAVDVRIYKTPFWGPDDPCTDATDITTNTTSTTNVTNTTNDATNNTNTTNSTGRPARRRPRRPP